MSNNLTHALAAAAMQCAFNVILDQPIIGLNIFVAGILAMLINLDRIDGMSGKHSPLGHSIGFGLIWIYVAVCVTYLAYAFDLLAGHAVLGLFTAVVSAYVTHLLLDAFTEEGIFSFPNLGKFGQLFKASDSNYIREWEAWGRLSLASPKRRLTDGRINIAMLLILLVFVAFAEIS